MLTAPPPGPNANAINQQEVGNFAVPGKQGLTAQGYPSQFSSSYAAPSSYAIPSSVNVPQQWYTQKDPNAAMAQALRGY